MNSRPITTIDEVIPVLKTIISECETNQDPLGYFAALYQKVTLKVKEGIAHGIFDDAVRMEKLDVIFANRYLDAWFAWQRHEPVTDSWRKAFELSDKYWPIVLQHLVI